MSRSWWGKFALLLFCVGLSAVYVYPTLSGLDPEKSRFPFKQKINLGLDLQGGLYMVLGVDFGKVFREVLDRQVRALQERSKKDGLGITGTSMVAASGEGAALDPLVKIQLEPARQEALKALIKKEYTLFRLVADTSGALELGLSRDYRDDVRERTIGQSIEVIRNRIDEFGVAEPSIASQGNDRVVVELPGVKDVQRAKDLIGRTAKLEFRIVDDQSMNPGQVAQLVAELEKQPGAEFREGAKFSDYVNKINELAKGKVPEGREISFQRDPDNLAAGGTGRVPYLLFERAEVTGEDLQDANVGFDQDQRPTVNFSLNPRGAETFGRLTEANKGKRLAIVLDRIVHMAPVINSKIEGNGQITVGRGNQDDLMREAKDLAIVLRAGALPAQLEFLEQRVVGPSLGQDSIQKGVFAALVGSALVFLFVSVYYRVSGVIAVISLILNVLFVLACLVGLEATLTLPGIAGIALTVGIAVDSNVVIYERIREELLAGKKAFGAVDAGFQKAFRTIVDANVTNAAAAVVLMLYGTGPIKGFAVSLLVGIVTTLFTAVFICRVLFDLYLRWLENRKSDALSI